MDEKNDLLKNGASLASSSAGKSTAAAALRASIRSGTFVGRTTSGLAEGFAQANLCILPYELAFDFLLFCQRNPKPCPLIAVLEKGEFLVPGDMTGGSTPANVRTDVPSYRIFRDGVLEKEVAELGEEVWRDDLVTFVIGCSFSFEEALIRAGIPLRHVQQQLNVPMFNTTIPCTPAGVFSGNMVVSMRPMTPANAIRATQVTARYARVHGAPVHIGDPMTIGITDILRPDYGDSVEVKEGEVPVFWACGVTPQAVVMKSKPHYCITHSPGMMLVLDVTNETLSLD